MSNRLSIVVALLALSPWSMPAAAEHSADAAYEAGDFALCARLYLAQAERSPPLSDARYNAACCFARAGEVDQAMDQLGLVDIEERVGASPELDPDLNALHADPRWPSLLSHWQAQVAEHTRGYDHALLAELKRRVAADQAARSDQARFEDAAAVDRDNTDWLKHLLQTRGWPPLTQIGTQGSQQIWILAQHADADRPFQVWVLELMKAAVARGDARPRHLAYLTDRVLRGQGKPQRYGTQFELRDGRMQPAPIEDPEQVDARRQAMGLETLAEYAARLSGN